MMNEGNGKIVENRMYISITQIILKPLLVILPIWERASGLGTQPSLDNLLMKWLSFPDIYHIYDRNVLLDASGKRAVIIESGYYKAYVISPITVDSFSNGSDTEICVGIYPETNGLPEYETVMGNVDDVGDEIEYTLPKMQNYALAII